MKISILLCSVALLAAACAKSPGPVTYKTGIDSYSGPYDGTNAIAYDSGDTVTVFIPRDCPSFSCNEVKSGGNLDKELVKKDCPKAQFLMVTFKGKPAVGKMALDGVVHIDSGGANGLNLDNSQLELATVSPLVASVHVPGDETVEGVFGAKMCPTK